MTGLRNDILKKDVSAIFQPADVHTQEFKNELKGLLLAIFQL
jgi:hypothetical protein